MTLVPQRLAHDPQITRGAGHLVARRGAAPIDLPANLFAGAAIRALGGLLGAIGDLVCCFLHLLLLLHGASLDRP
jgi:hypothetical protein